jgi:dTDP-4-dehydrorhamnose reductase
VTGATGLLGRVVVLDNRDRHEVVALTHAQPLDVPDVRSVQVDLTDGAALSEAWDTVQPDLVLHTAALATIEACERDPELARRINVDATAALARLAASTGARMVHVSTDAVFDGTAGPYRESDQPAPISVYARTKLAAEDAVLGSCPDALVARVNFFGWSRSGTRSLAEFFFNALSQGTAVRGFTDVEFTSLYSRDTAARLVTAAEEGLSGLFHVGSSDRLSKFEFGRALARAFGFDETLVQPGSVAGLGAGALRSNRLSMDSSAFADATGRPMPTVAEGLERMRQDRDSGYAARIRGTDHLEAGT